MVDMPGDVNDRIMMSWSADCLHPATNEQLATPTTSPKPTPTKLDTSPMLPVTPIYWCDPVTVILEQIEENTQHLLCEWPKDDGIPFPNEVLGMLDSLKTEVKARDKEKI